MARLGRLVVRAIDALRSRNITLEELYRRNCRTPSDINEHCPTLCELARECCHVTEFGVRKGISTSALLYAQPGKLVCYDLAVNPRLVAQLQELAGRTELEFRGADVLAVEIEPTDFLFIDTWHAYVQLKQELAMHAGRARRYIAVHDTRTYARRGDTCRGTRDPQGGLLDALDEFLGTDAGWEITAQYDNNNGLTVLERKCH